MTDKFETILMFFPIFLFSLSFHEAAHAYAAHKMGDDTAKQLGRMTLNPLPHIDIVGTILFPLLMILMPGFLFFGWAKPVPVNFYNLRGGRKGHLRVAAAGPISNLILALIFVAALHFLVNFAAVDKLTQILYGMFHLGVYLNFMLAFFNLIPIHPLDGSGIMEGLLPQKYLYTFHKLGRYGFLILIVALYTGALGTLAVPVLGLADFLMPG